MEKVMFKRVQSILKMLAGLVVTALLIVTAVVLMGDFGQVYAQSNEIKICEQNFYYGDQAVRSAQVWQYQSPSSDVTETYIVEDFRGTSVCSYSLVDLERDVVFSHEGSVRQYQRASNTPPEFPCAEPLAGGDISGSAIDEEYRVTYNIRTIASSTLIEIDYPTNLLLAPTFVGEFPLLAPAELRPYDGRGFAVDMSLDQIRTESGITIEGSIDADALNAIVEYLLTEIPGWELAPQDRTGFPANPYVVIGNRDVYLSFVNPESEDILRVEFHLNARNQVLQMLVTTPPVPQISEVVGIEAIEGSSGNLAAKSSLFEGWNGAEDGPDGVYLDGRIESYTLFDGDQTWFLDLEVEGDDYEVIYSRVVTEASCDPDLFLPAWATENDD
ncbi:MAG: hypothetical protein KJ065_07105 [Anaerolineae bacterium]|nr:hypothetical protein [Anaerolineae bacterium]